MIDMAGKDIMKEYEVMVTEKLVKTLSILAETKEQMLEKVQRMIKQEELVLTADDFVEREIDVMFEKVLDIQEGIPAEKKPEMSFYVACCGEFHSMAPMYEGISTAKEALVQYEEAMETFSAYMPEIGIRASYKESPEQDVEWGLLQGRVLDLSLLDRIEGIVNADSALYLIGELVSAVKNAADVSSSSYRINGECAALNKVTDYNARVVGDFKK